ncbi:chitosanase, partial [Bacillus cereus]
KWVNSGWDWMENKRESYFSDSYKFINYVIYYRKWWKPVPDDKKYKIK